MVSLIQERIQYIEQRKQANAITNQRYTASNSTNNANTARSKTSK